MAVTDPFEGIITSVRDTSVYQEGATEYKPVRYSADIEIRTTGRFPLELVRAMMQGRKIQLKVVEE